MMETPTGVFSRGVRALLAGDMAEFVALFADDAVMEFPFAPPDRPSRLSGRAAVREYLSGYPDLVDVREIKDLVLHQTTDPGVIVAEFAAAGVVVATGRQYELRYVAVLTVRDGLITRYRDYWNPLASPEPLRAGLGRS